MTRLVKDLLEDWRNEERKAPHFLGSIIIHNHKTKDLQVRLIDGQQRLTSISIVLALLRDKVKADDRLRQTLANYLVQPPADGRSHAFTRIDHHRGDEQHFAEYVITSTASKPLSKDEQAERMRLNVEVARSLLAQIVTDEDIAAFRTHLMTQCELIRITIGKEDDAFRIFRTVNGTGQPVRDQDVLRVTLIERATDVAAKRKSYSDRWDQAEAMLGAEEFETYLRLKRFELAGALDLDASLKFSYESQFQQGDPALTAFLEGLTSDTESYADLLRNAAPMLSFGRGYRIPSILHSLSLVQFDDWKALALALYARFKATKRTSADRKDLASWMRKLERLAWRYEFSTGERFYDENRIERFANILRYFRNIPPEKWVQDASAIDLMKTEKADMLSAISGEIDPRWPALRQVLLRLEMALNGGSYPRAINKNGYTIEHVLPKSGEGGWAAALGITVPEARRLALKLGNLCFVTNNKELDVHLFPTKKKLIEEETDAKEESSLTADVCSHDDWTTAIIATRTQRLADVLARELELR